MESGKAGMYAPAGGYYASTPNYVNQQYRVEAAPPMNPYVYTDKVSHEPDCRYNGVSPERRRKNRVANALAAAFIVCWCCTWPCHGPCCCGL